MLRHFVVWTICFILLCYNQLILAHTDSGRLFSVTSSGDALSLTVQLCLNGQGPTSCEDVTVTNSTLSIFTTIAHHTYPQVGIKALSSGYTLTGCTLSSNGYCIFTASDTQAANVSINSSNAAPVLGHAFEGGIVGCLNGGLQNLIASVSDNSASIQWGGFGTTTNAQSLTDGAANTATIVGVLGNNGGIPYAAQLCNNYQIDSKGNTPCQGGNTCYKNWFLPSQDQLNCLYTNRTIIGGFTSNQYYTSSEFTGVPSDFAWIKNFGTGMQNVVDKFAAIYVRCVRQVS